MNRTTNWNVFIECELSRDYFEEWEALKPEIKAWWENDADPVGCEGTGIMTPRNCKDCPYCATYEQDEMGN